MPRFVARAEFRRLDRATAWVLAGAWVEDRFAAAEPGVEPIRGRLPEPGLVGWIELPLALIASNADAASVAALEIARKTWPKSDRLPVPYATGVAEPGMIRG
jgi:hypothetical protein